MSNKEIAILYANEIIYNVIPACQYMVLAAKRFINDLNDERYYYNDSAVDAVIQFINTLYLTETSKKKHFILEPWQTFIVCNLYGIYKKETETRKYKYAYIELARKNGKSQLVTALALYHLIFDPDAQVIVSANSREQAKNVDFKKVKQFAAMLDNKGKHLKQYYNSIKFKNNELIVTASEASKLDGLSASFAIIDELHEAPDNKMYNVIKSSMGAREMPLFIVITTAGFNTESFCYKLRSYCIDVLNNIIEDNSQFTVIYTIDENDNYEDKNNWIKANPNIAISVNPEFISDEVNKAVQNEAERNGVLVKHFNVWTRANTEEVWIPEKYIIESMQKLSINDDMFSNVDGCWVGIDLGSVSDITSVTKMIQLDDKLIFINDYYIPEDSINSNINKDLFRDAALRGEIHITSGNVCDYDRILTDLLEVNKVHPIQNIGYDKWNSTQFIISATDAGLFSTPYSQTAGSLNKPIKELQRLLMTGNIILQKNSITKWMFMNVIIKQNQMGNLSLDKSNKSKKIDGVASICNCLGLYLESPRYAFNVY